MILPLQNETTWVNFRLKEFPRNAQLAKFCGKNKLINKNV